MERLVWVGLVLVLVGMLLIVVGVVGSALKVGRGEGRVEAGGVVFIGPIPIVFGTSRGVTTVMLVLALAVTLLLLVFYLLQARQGRLV